MRMLWRAGAIAGLVGFRRPHPERQDREQHDPPGQDIDDNPGNPAHRFLTIKPLRARSACRRNPWGEGTARACRVRRSVARRRPAPPPPAVADHPPARRAQAIARRPDIGDLIADVMHAAVGVAREKTAHRRALAKRLEQFDARIAELDKNGRHAVLGKLMRRQHRGAERVAIERSCRRQIGNDNGDVVQFSDHRSLITLGPHSRTGCTSISARLPMRSLIALRSARFAASRTEASSRRIVLGSDSTAAVTASRSFPEMSAVSDASTSPMREICGGAARLPARSMITEATRAPWLPTRPRCWKTVLLSGRRRLP